VAQLIFSILVGVGFYVSLTAPFTNNYTYSSQESADIRKYLLFMTAPSLLVSGLTYWAMVVRCCPIVENPDHIAQVKKFDLCTMPFSRYVAKYGRVYNDPEFEQSLIQELPQFTLDRFVDSDFFVGRDPLHSRLNDVYAVVDEVKAAKRDFSDVKFCLDWTNRNRAELKAKTVFCRYRPTQEECDAQAAYDEGVAVAQEALDTVLRSCSRRFDGLKNALILENLPEIPGSPRSTVYGDDDSVTSV
jgi:hypothetical protein